MCVRGPKAGVNITVPSRTERASRLSVSLRDFAQSLRGFGGLRAFVVFSPSNKQQLSSAFPPFVLYRLYSFCQRRRVPRNDMDSILGHLQWSEDFLYFAENSRICSRDILRSDNWLALSTGAKLGEMWWMSRIKVNSGKPSTEISRNKLIFMTFYSYSFKRTKKSIAPMLTNKQFQIRLCLY